MYTIKHTEPTFQYAETGTHASGTVTKVVVADGEDDG